MNPKYILSLQATTELTKIARYYLDQRSAELAEYIVQEFTLAFEKIGNTPQIGHARLDLTDRPYRFYLVFRYYVIFEANTSPVHIARICHSAGDLNAVPTILIEATLDNRLAKLDNRMRYDLLPRHSHQARPFDGV